MSANGSTFNLDVDGNHAWELLFDIDNSKNSGSVRRQFEVKTSVSCSFHKMRKDVLNSSVAVSAGLSYGKVVEILKISVKGDMNHEVKYNYETMSESKLEYKTETTKTDVFEIGPNSRIKMYRLVFDGPGINYISDTISSTPHVIDPVNFKFVVREVLFLEGIDVVYTDDSVSRPANVINEVNGKSPDINADNIGLPVWLVPRWTKKFDQAANGIHLAIQSKENSNYINLSRGSRGSYRYIRMELDPSFQK
ncbi:hypothetical protein Ocin01_18839 [Orchesella cincta]|uniref:Uncharacterized protein n=1 Tax=Orchesella cincta TaxID=48709 RepID=A0A1D2M4E8_ORCCI|nr:hypothetical protein Ocin01_18839 [Orchesella cincta]